MALHSAPLWTSKGLADIAWSFEANYHNQSTRKLPLKNNRKQTFSIWWDLCPLPDSIFPQNWRMDTELSRMQLVLDLNTLARAEGKKTGRGDLKIQHPDCSCLERCDIIILLPPSYPTPWTDYRYRAEQCLLCWAFTTGANFWHANFWLCK